MATKQKFVVGYSYSIPGVHEVHGSNEIEVDTFTPAEAIYRAEAVLKQRNPSMRVGPQFYVKRAG